MFDLRIWVTVTLSPPMARAKSATWVVVATTASFPPAAAGVVSDLSLPHATSATAVPIAVATTANDRRRTLICVLLQECVSLGGTAPATSPWPAAASRPSEPEDTRFHFE